MLLLIVLVRRLHTVVQPCWPRATFSNGLPWPAVRWCICTTYRPALPTRSACQILIQLCRVIARSRRVVGGWFTTRFLACGSDHHDHLPAFQLGKLLDHDAVSQIVTKPVEQSQSKLLVRDLAATKTQRDLAFIAIGQKPADVAQLDVVVTVVRTGAEFDFLDLDDRLLSLGRLPFSAPDT